MCPRSVTCVDMTQDTFSAKTLKIALLCGFVLALGVVCSVFGFFKEKYKLWENPGARVMCLFSFGWPKQTGQEQSLNQVTPEFLLLIFPFTYYCCPSGATSYIEKLSHYEVC